MEQNKHTNSTCEGGKCIKGITCDVKNCMYHAENNSCHAGSISVGPREADCSANTSCVTFKPKEI